MVFETDAPDGIVLPTIFAARRLKDAELSVSRQQHTPLEIVMSAVVAQRSPRSGSCLGGLRAKVADIRAETLKDEISYKRDQVRLYCVTDDPDMEANYDGHAVIGFSELTKPHGRGNFWKRNNVTAVIGNLMLIFNAGQGPIGLDDMFLSTANDGTDGPAEAALG